MFAVIKTGGKQYRVQPGDRFTVEKLAGEAGDTVTFGDVLMLGGDEPRFGTPFVDGASVEATVVEQTRGPKLLNFKRRRRKASSKRLKGHRQHLTLVEIKDILADGKASGAKPKAKKAKAKDEAPKAEAPAAAAESAGSKPANLLDAPKGEADDLAEISGVGPKLVEKLNANGVFHFWQIAEWTPEEVAHMDEQLSFKGRIERDDWIGQAKALAAGDDAGEAKE